MKSTQLPRFAHSTVHQDNEPCRNCATVFCGNYCPGCGQEALTGAPTTMGFIYEFLTRNILERGKLPRTLWQLLRHPGSLTVDFLEGRRQRSIRPVRLYFGLSVLYFLLVSMTSNFDREFANKFGNDRDASSAAEVSESEQTKHIPGRTASPPSVLEPKLEMTSKDLDFLDQVFPQDVAKELKWRISRFANQPEREAVQALTNGMMHQISKAMFFLLPVFAFILKCLFFTRRIPYGAHLLFAFHYHAMVFACLLVLLLPLPGIVGFIIFVWACLYLPLAMRRTYDIGWLSTLWRCFMLSIFYLLAVSLAMLGALAATVLL
ncbi:MAG: DUF3667 domain-containing protein [Pseudomonadota bacterium]